MLSAKLALIALAAAPADGAVSPLPMVSEAAVEAAVPVDEQKPEQPAPDDIDLAEPQSFPDPLEPLNRVFYDISQPIDRIVLRPLAMTYQVIVPKPARDGARNAIANLAAPVTFANDVLQLRPDRAVRTLGRFLINSTIGLFGLFDIAKRKPFHLAPRSNGFGSTLGYYGIGPGFYVYLPVLGPTTLRDFPAGMADGQLEDEFLDKVLHPQSGRKLFRGKPDTNPESTVITIVDGLDQRAENDFELKTFREDSVDPYAALRANFMQNRAGEIAELKAMAGEAPKAGELDDPLLDPEDVAGK